MLPTTSMTLIIVVVTVVISLMAFQDRRLFQRFMFEPFVIHSRKDWSRLITHGFIHGNVPHLAVNMFVLYMFGPQVEEGYAEITGRSPMLLFLLMYVGAIVLSSLPGYFKHRLDPNYRAVGASGATSAVVFASILMFPTTRLALIMLPIPLPAWLFGIIYLAYEWYMGKRGNDGIAHDAHFFGALVGMAFTTFLDPHVITGFVEAMRASFA